MTYHSFGRTPLGNQGSSTASGERQTQPGAEFPGKRVKKDPLYYEPYHGKYNEFGLEKLPVTDKTWARDRPYAKREKISRDIRRSGVVTLEDAKVIRQRNLPLLFSCQLREHRGPAGSLLRRIYNILFPTGHVYHSQDPKDRPKAGCIQTKFWTDLQVDTWGKFANAYGIRYSGETEYSFPKALLGIISHGGVYPSKHPWPKPSDPGPLQAVVRVRNRRRTESSRIMRNLNKLRKKEVRIKPLPVEQVLVVRKIYSRKTIDKMFDFTKPISQHRDEIPNCLSLAFGPPAPVSDIVLESIRKIYSNPKKFLDDPSWLIPKGKSLSYTVDMKLAPTRAQSERARRIVTLHSDQGGVFRNSVGTGHSLYLVDTNFHGLIKGPSDRKKVIDNFRYWQSELDSKPDEYTNTSGVLGGWFD